MLLETRIYFGLPFKLSGIFQVLDAWPTPNVWQIWLCCPAETIALVFQSMRVIGGRYRGRRLATVRANVRPTGDRLRESLFDILGAGVEGSSWLDGFAGSGAVGIEALSRGAAHVTFNDRNAAALRLLRKNLGLCAIEEGFEVHRKDIFVLLRQLRHPKRFDFVFLDPPYDFGRHVKLLDRTAKCPLIQEGAMVILESRRKSPLPETPASLQPVREIHAGNSRLSFYRRD